MLFFIALTSHIDRTNVSFAALDMNRDLGISSTFFGLAAGIFFIGYAAGGLPHAAILDRFRNHRWIGAMVGLWGACCILLAFVPNPALFVIVRFVLGLAESAFIPAVYTCLSRFYASRDLAGATATFAAAAAAASLLGAPLAAVLLQIDWADLVGWQWLFVLQGLPALLIAPFVARLVPYDLDDALWLPEAGRRWLRENRITSLDAPSAMSAGATLTAVIRTRPVIVLGAVYFLVNLGFWGLVFFLPQIVKNGFPGTSSAQVSLISGIPYAVALVAMIVFGRTSVRTGDRRWHIAGATVGAGFSLLVSVNVSQGLAQLVALTVGIALAYSLLGLYHSVTASVLHPNVRSMGLSLVNGLGLLGGFVGPYLFGLLASATGSTSTGLSVLAASFGVGAALVIVSPREFPSAGGLALPAVVESGRAAPAEASGSGNREAPAS